MKFWQAIITGQLAAGSVFADRVDGFAPHIAAEVASVLIAGAMWVAARRLWPSDEGR